MLPSVSTHESRRATQVTLKAVVLLASVMVVVDRHEVVDRVLVMDFGLARPTAVGEALVVREPTTGDAIAQDTGITRTGGMLRTPAYMAPEQHLGQAIDHRSDQFAY